MKGKGKRFVDELQVRVIGDGFGKGHIQHLVDQPRGQQIGVMQSFCWSQLHHVKPDDSLPSFQQRAEDFQRFVVPKPVRLRRSGGWHDCRIEEINVERYIDLIAQRISHNLQRLRDKRQLTLEALAQASGVRRAMIAQIEAGRSFPSVKVLSKVATALSVSIAEFLDPDGQPYEDQESFLMTIQRNAKDVRFLDI